MSALTRIQEVWDNAQAFYGFCFVDEDTITDAEMQEVAEWAQDQHRMYFAVVPTVAAAVTKGSTLLDATGQTHYCLTYHPEADTVGAVMGMALDQRFDQKDGIKTLKFKLLQGVTPSTVTETQAANLDGAGVNYFAPYGNLEKPVSFFAQGYAGGGAFYDFVVGLDWLRNRIEVNVVNLFLQTRKVPQTETGMALLKGAVARGCEAGVTNGLIAPGQWNQPGIGAIEQGDYLDTGYYLWADRIKNQPQEVRETREAPPITVLVKGAGALHGADITIVPEV